MHNGLFVAKVLHPELAAKPGVLRSFRAEATHAAELGGHPNAVPIFDFGELDGLFFMLMPFVEGEDLDRVLLRTGPLGKPEALQMLAQVSSLLCTAESAGIAHCDLSPGNIRLDVFGRYRVLDFGISRSRAVPDGHPFTGGTPLYSSPEQIAGKDPDIRSDLYALGAIFGEALAGKPLFEAASLQDVRRRHLQSDWKLPAALEDDKPVARLLRNLLQVDREQRFHSAYELSGLLDARGYLRPEFRALPTAPREAGQPSRRSRLSAE